MLAIELLRRPPSLPTRIVLIERDPEMCRGVAYAAHEVPYLLNVPAARLSADSLDPRSFVKFAEGRLGKVDPEDFLPRSLYGEYLQHSLATAEAAAADGVSLKRMRAEAVDVAPHPEKGFDIAFADGSTLRADRIVLATGMPRTDPPEWSRDIKDSPRYRNHPWDLPKSDVRSALIVGNGLTMVDAVFNLSAQQTPPALFTLSRRGLVPQPQTKFSPATPPGAERLLASASSARGLLAAGRAIAAEVQEAGGDWREVLTLLRQLAPRLWRQLPGVEKQRFLRHLQVFWDTHRHRMPPQLTARLAALKAQGRLGIGAGRVQRAQLTDDGVRIWWRSRGKLELDTMSVDLVINATGPDSRLSRSSDALLKALLHRGLIEADEFELGIRTDLAGQCLATSGPTHAGFFYIGPMMRADHWEATAVPELRRHAELLAEKLRTTSERHATAAI